MIVYDNSSDLACGIVEAGAFCLREINEGGGPGVAAAVADAVELLHHES